MKQPLTLEEFKTIYSKVPRVNVEVIVKTDKGIVLTKRNVEPEIGKWHIPGGTIYFGEFVEDAVKRVAMDELGVSVEILKSLGYIEYPIMRKDGYYGWPIGLAFEARTVSGSLQGSEQGELVGEFEKTPENIIEDQRVFLDRVWSQL